VCVCYLLKLQLHPSDAQMHIQPINLPPSPAAAANALYMVATKKYLQFNSDAQQYSVLQHREQTFFTVCIPQMPQFSSISV